MKDRLPEDLFALLEQAGKTADQHRVSLYAVGGFVRDLLLAIPNLDVDLVVEGNGIRFAKALARGSKARITVHERFGTATITLPDGHAFDVATARTESYDAPAALPRVQQGSLSQDLYRRDFTINTLAIRLDSPRFGELTDLYRGRRDLRDRTIRVLHGLSFIDDPTRVFRAIRFEQRLGFRLDGDTAVLMKEAVKMGGIRRLSPSRLSHELLHVLSEPIPVTMLARLADFNLLPCIHPRLKWSPGLARLLNAVEKAVAWHARLSRPLSSWIVYAMALLDPLPGPAALETLARLTFPRRQTRQLVWMVHEGERVLQALHRRTRPSAIFRLLRDCPDETLLFLMAKTRTEREKIISVFTSYRHVSPILKGKDLKAMGIRPGPLYTTILDRLLEARLDGTVETETDERRLVSRLR